MAFALSFALVATTKDPSFINLHVEVLPVTTWRK
jgi:hypothetical protein